MDSPGPLPRIDHMKDFVNGVSLYPESAGILRFPFSHPGNAGILPCRAMAGRAAGHDKKAGKQKLAFSIYERAFHRAIMKR